MGCAKMLGWTAASVIALLVAHAHAQDLVPQTRLRLTVAHWLPVEGEFRRWDALSGDLLVSPLGELSVPVIGPLPVAGLDTDALAAQIAERLKAEMGFIDLPNVRIEIVEQPPIYILGEVMTPGQYPYRPGLTVMQALALGGGLREAEEAEAPAQRIELLSRLQIMDNDLRRVLGRLARLHAEAEGAETIDFPPEVMEAPQGAAIMEQEQNVFTTRSGSLVRQQTSLTELRELYNAEIDVLQTRISNLDERIANTEADLANVTTLLDRGLATVSRRTELEVILGDLRADRLDHVTAMMRARQFLNQAERDMTGLEDLRQSEIAQALLTEDTALERLKTEQTMVQRLLEELDRDLLRKGETDPASAVLIYSVVRGTGDGSQEFAVDETTPLLPGDVVRIAVSRSGAAPAEAGRPAVLTPAVAEGL